LLLDGDGLETTFSIIASSVGRRSIEDAPKKPTTPFLHSITHAASSGSAIGPHGRAQEYRESSRDLSPGPRAWSALNAAISSPAAPQSS
jgi:hypothetical protein